MLTSRFKKNLERSILGYQCVMQGPNIPIRGTTWEFLMYQAAVKSGISCEWKSGSHAPGSDITIAKTRYSCKTTKIIDGDHLDVSSYRLSTTASSADPRRFINEIDHARNNFDFYAILTREQKGETVMRYSIYRVPTASLKAGSLDWVRDSNGNWKGYGPDFQMKIHKSMAYQLWMNVPLKYIDEDHVFDVELGNNIQPIDFADIYTARRTLVY